MERVGLSLDDDVVILDLDGRDVAADVVDGEVLASGLARALRDRTFV